MTGTLSASTLRAVRDEVNAGTDRFAGDIAELAACNSGSNNAEGIRRVQDRLAVQLAARSVPTLVLDPPEVASIDHLGHRQRVQRGPILHGRHRPGERRRLLVMGHADTVFGPDHPFQTVERVGNHLHGPGVADMKGGLVAFLAALDVIERDGLAPGLGVDLVVNGDEEVGSLASEATMLDRGRTACAALVLEPRMADGSVARARSGSANLTFSVAGRSAHAGRELNSGRNAVLAAARLAISISEVERDDLGVNVAALHGGEAFNAVPASATVRVNLRSPRARDLRWAIDEADRLARAVSDDREVLIERTGDVHRPAKPWTEASQRVAEVVEAVSADLQAPIRLVDTGGVCDGNNLASLGLGVVDTLGVHGSGIHTVEERMDLARFGEVVALLTGVIHAIAVHPEIEPEAV